MKYHIVKSQYRRTAYILIGLCATVLISIGLISVANAACNKYFCSYNVPGFFYGNPATPKKMKSVLPNSGGAIMAIPDDRALSKADLITFLQERNADHMDEQNKKGSAFITCLLLQDKVYNNCVSHGYIAGIKITPQGWEELRVRLDNPRLTANFYEWAYRTADFTNSAYDLSNRDAYIYTRGKDEQGTAIRLYIDGSPVFSMFRACANPIDSIPGLPVVPKNYTLTPSVDVSPDDVVEAGSNVTINPWVNNTGEISSAGTEWKLSRTPVSTNTLPSGSGAVFAVGNTPLTPYVDSDTDVAPGTRLCYVLSVRPHSNTDPGWINSAEDCVYVGKRPKVQVHGSDLVVGNVFNNNSGSTVPLANITTATSVKKGFIFGSWVEYGMFASGIIRGTASGAAFAGSGIVSTSSVCDYSKLSFANSGDKSSCSVNLSSGGNIGSYSNGKLIPDISAIFSDSGVALGSSVSPNDLLTNPGTFIGSRTGDFIVNSSTLTAGKTVVLKVSGKVTIAGNQEYFNGPYKEISQIPQLIIIADKIVINNNVTRVDAWLIANGSNGIIETCNTGSDVYALSGAQRLTINKCNQQLIVNGPVMAKHLWLRRTAGSDPCNGTDCSPSGIPAEIFNLRPDAYLWSISRTTASGRIRTVNTTELPPRL